ncbi:MAG: hypothetical protein F4Y87_03405 [Synechococcus sp. SB0665_bin_28]|nr:hypothetical protein [Synechococcus sp. SB0665_bin_28]
MSHNRVFPGLAQRGPPWGLGLKLHLGSNHKGHARAFRITAGRSEGQPLDALAAAGRGKVCTGLRRARSASGGGATT